MKKKIQPSNHLKKGLSQWLKRPILFHLSMGNCDTKVGDCVGKCLGQTNTQTNSYFINIDNESPIF